MRRARPGRLIGRLLPSRTRRDLFEPSAADLAADRARASRPAPRFALVLLLLDCWRLAPAEVLGMFFNDLRHAFRLLRRDVLFTATIVLTLTLGALPGVQSVGTAAVMPLTGNVWSVPFDRADRPVPAGERAPGVGWQAATEGYFTALGIPLIEGRLFSRATDTAGSPGVVIISEAVRDRFFEGQSAVGRRVRLARESRQRGAVAVDVHAAQAA
ncbi:MAG: ABC transporter permease [Acidobacteriota bacterium]|nr:ABC transporter permease [Acidobacteriota bacterium]